MSRKKIILCIKYYFLIQSQIYLYSCESRKFWQIKIISNSTPYIHLSSKHIHKLHARWHNHNWASWNFLHFWHPFNSASKTHLLWHRNDVNSFSVSQLSRVQIPLAVLSEKQNHWEVTGNHPSGLTPSPFPHNSSNQTNLYRDIFYFYFFNRNRITGDDLFVLFLHFVVHIPRPETQILLFLS